MCCLYGWVNVQEFFISVEAEGERLGNGKLCVERTEKLGHAWKGGCKDCQVPNAAKTGPWGGSGVATQMSLLRTLIHPCCLSDVHLPSFLLMLWGPCYYHLLEQPPSPTWLLMGSDTHAVCNLTVLQTWKCCALSRTKLLLSSEMLSGGFTQLFRLSASWLQRTMCTGKRVSLVICCA